MNDGALFCAADIAREGLSAHSRFLAGAGRAGAEPPERRPVALEMALQARANAGRVRFLFGAWLPRVSAACLPRHALELAGLARLHWTGADCHGPDFIQELLFSFLLLCRSPFSFFCFRFFLSSFSDFNLALQTIPTTHD